MSNTVKKKQTVASFRCTSYGQIRLSQRKPYWCCTHSVLLWNFENYKSRGTKTTGTAPTSVRSVSSELGGQRGYPISTYERGPTKSPFDWPHIEEAAECGGKWGTWQETPRSTKTRLTPHYVVEMICYVLAEVERTVTWLEVKALDSDRDDWEHFIKALVPTEQMPFLFLSIYIEGVPDKTRHTKITLERLSYFRGRVKSRPRSTKWWPSKIENRVYSIQYPKWTHT